MKKHLLIILSLLGGIAIQAQSITTVAGGNGYGSDSNQLAYPYGIWIDKTGSLYVSDQNNNRVQKFPAGSTSLSLGVTISGGNQLSSPSGICADTGGGLYVADYINDRILRYYTDSIIGGGAIIYVGGATTGILPNELSLPLAVFLDAAGNMYVADADNNRIQKFPPNSTPSTNAVTVAGGNGQGSAANQLSYPSSVYVDSTGGIYVADYLNSRVQFFPEGSDTSTMGITVAGGNGPGSAANQLSNPAGVFLDRAGYLYVSDMYNNRIQRFPPGSDSTTNGVTVAGGNGEGSAMNQLDNPANIYIDSAGDLYIADFLNNRVQKWQAGATGINDPSLITNTLSLYPNPNSGTFTLHTNGCIGDDVIVCDILGRPVAQIAVSADRQVIQMLDLSPGSYTLTLKGDFQRAVRFVIEN